jgi:hypothetical protein
VFAGVENMATSRRNSTTTTQLLAQGQANGFEGADGFSTSDFDDGPEHPGVLATAVYRQLRVREA